MAKLTLQQTLDKSLKTAKQYIDTELAKKADSHTHNYLPLTGGTLSGKLKINGPASDQPLQVRGIVGNSADGSSVDGLYLQYGANKEVYFGNSGGYTISADGSNYTGNAATATKLQTTRTLTVGNTGKTFDGSANVSWSLADIGAAAASHGHDFYVQGTSLSRTTNQDGNANDINQSGFYRPNNTASATNPFPDGMHSHILHGQHPSSTYAYQIGVPFVTHNKIYFRSHNSTSWSSWNKIYHSGDKPTPADIGAAASGHTHNYAGSSSAGGTANSAARLDLSRITGSSNSANYVPGANRLVVREYGNDCTNMPSAHWYHIYTGQGSDANYNTQLAVGMTTEALHFRNKNSGTWGSWKKVSVDGHTHSYANKFLSRDEYTQITVNGDANKYYPVILSTSNVSSYPTIIVNISRTYSWTAPNTWNTSTHKGGLTFTLEWNCSKYWDGNGTGSSTACYVTQFLESYCTMVAGLSSSTSGIVVWLRGGGALYQINSSIGKAVTAEVKLEGFTDAASQTFSARDYNATTVNNEIKKRWVNRSTSGVYDNNNRVYSAANPQTTINGLNFWTGTQAQYDALSSKSSTTVYIIK